MLVCRAAACWVRQAMQQCHAMSPRPCMVFITADSDEVCSGPVQDMQWRR